MPRPEDYSLEQISEFLLTEKVANHGLNSEVYQQNQEIISCIRGVAEDFGPQLLGVQLFGSRATGISHLHSDIDLNFLLLQPPGEHRGIEEARFASSLRARFQKNSDLSRLYIDFEAAQAMQLHGDTPGDPQWLKEDVANYPWEWQAAFEGGIYDTPGRSLAALAVATTLLRSPYVSSRHWQEMKAKHAAIFLGNHTHMTDRLVERSDFSSEAIASSITPELMAERHQRFGLPKTIQEQHQQLRSWYDRQPDSIRQEPAHALL